MQDLTYDCCEALRSSAFFSLCIGSEFADELLACAVMWYTLNESRLMVSTLCIVFPCGERDIVCCEYR